MMLSCRNVGKKFRRYEQGESLKRYFVRRLRGEVAREEWNVLSGVNLDVRPGERVAVIGRNGCGKSTLLKLMAGIYAPTTGTVTVGPGRVLALIELGVGFYPDLTGRQNMRLNWALNGLPLAELRSRFESIAEFSGVEEFLDTPLKYYSSGMSARLGFALAMHARPELLIVDEVLAVGDLEFQQKCHARIESLCSAGATLILVSHNLGDVSRVCRRGVWINGGTVAFDGPVEEAVALYTRSLQDAP
ncbi:MAG: ABC transporter ATP-binding protein [Bacteroidota bacterium]